MISTIKSISQKEQQSVLLTSTNLHSSDMTSAGNMAGQAVQLLVDTGACVPAMDVQLVKKTYGQITPKGIVESLPSIQAVSGDTAPVLGKITIPHAAERNVVLV